MAIGSTIRTVIGETVGAAQFLLFVGALFVYAPLLSSVVLRLFPSAMASFHDPAVVDGWKFVDYVDSAIPFFVVSVVTELVVSKMREAKKRAADPPIPGNGANLYSKYPSYRLNDTINSMSLGLLQQTVHSLSWAKPLLYAPYLYVWKNWAIMRLPSDSVWTWIMCFVLVEFGYYWYHRMGHEMNVFWSAHIAHHSSQELNLSTALRQGSWQYFFAFVYYTPGALLIPPVVFNALSAFNRIYQFWIHTEYIVRCPDWYEYVFVTPSHHRVHHAANPQYCDKNYGGTLIVFDRLFGTFEAEVEPCVYGLTRNLNSWNPVWGNVHHWQHMYRMSTKLSGLNKLRVLWNGPGWNPTDGGHYQLPAKPAGEKRHNTSVYSLWSYAYVIVSYASCVVVLKVLAAFGSAGAGTGQLTSIEVGVCVAYLVSTTTAIGGMLDQRPWAYALDRIRLIASLIAGVAITYIRSNAAAAVTFRRSVAAASDGDSTGAGAAPGMTDAVLALVSEAASDLIANPTVGVNRLIWASTAVSIALIVSSAVLQSIETRKHAAVLAAAPPPAASASTKAKKSS